MPTIAFSGVTDVRHEAWALVEGLAPAYGDDWWYRGLLAFVRQDQGRYDEADELAWSALRVEPAAGHAVHAKTHVYYETGEHIAGLEWLDPGSPPAAREHRTARTSRGTPRCTSCRSATSTRSAGGTSASSRRRTSPAYERSSTPPRCCGGAGSPSRGPATCR